MAPLLYSEPEGEGVIEKQSGPQRLMALFPQMGLRPLGEDSK